MDNNPTINIDIILKTCEQLHNINKELKIMISELLKQLKRKNTIEHKLKESRRKVNNLKEKENKLKTELMIEQLKLQINEQKLENEIKSEIDNLKEDLIDLILQ